MKQAIRSHSSRLNSELQQLFMPTWPRVILDIILAIILLAAVNAKAIWDYFGGISISQPSVVSQVINGESPQMIYRFIDRLTEGRLVQVIFWLFVGCSIYILIWFVGTIVTNIRNDIVADAFIHPASYNRSKFWGSVIAHKVFLASLAVVFIGYIFLILKISLLLSNLSYAAIADFSWLDSLAEIIGAVIVVAVMLQILFILGRILLNAWQVVYKDL